MLKIVFATRNQNKIDEARSILGVDIEGTSLKINEIQSLDPKEVALEKAREYYKKLKRSVVVEDNSFFFEGLNGLPGTLIDYFSDALENDGLINLLKGNKNRKAVAQSTLVYIDKRGREYIFIGRVRGRIAKKPKGDKGFGWDPIFIPDGLDRTFAQMDLEEKNKYSMRKKAFVKFKNWLHKAS